MDYTPHNLSEKELKWSYWWLNNIGNFKLFGYTVAFALVGLLWLFVFYSLIMTAIDWNNELSYKNILNRQPKYQIIANDAPQPFTIGTAIVLNAGQQKYDIVIPIENNDSNWIISNLKYKITYNDQSETEVKEVIVLPEQKNYLTAFSITSERKPYNINVEIIDQRWRRMAQVNALPIDFKITPAKSISTNEGVGQQIEVDIYNNSLVNYWEIKWLAVGFSGAQPVAIQEVTTDEFVALTSRKVYFSWSNRLPRIDKVEVIPDFNIFDLSLSYKIQAEPLAY